MLGDRTRRSVRPHEPVRRHGTGSATRRMDRRRPQQPCKVPCRLVRTSYVLNCRRHPVWYFITFANSGYSIRDNGSGKAATQAVAEPSDEQLWKLVGTQEKFQLINKAGRYARVTGSGDNARLTTGSTAYSSGFSLIETGNSTYSPQLGDQSQLHIHRQRQIQPVGRNGNRTSHRLLERQRRKQSSGVRSRKRHALPRLQSDRINHLQTRIQTLALVHRSCHSHRSRQHLDGILAAPRQRPAWRKHVQRREPRPDSHERKNALERTQHRQRRIIRRLSQLRITFVDMLDEAGFGYTNETAAGNYYRTLDLSTATGESGFTSPDGSVSFKRQYIVSYPDGVVAVRISASNPERFSRNTPLKAANPASSPPLPLLRRRRHIRRQTPDHSLQRTDQSRCPPAAK